MTRRMVERDTGAQGGEWRVPTAPAPFHEPSVTPAPVRPRAVLLMGVSGSGKTTVGRAVADAHGWAFADADAYHDPAALDKMARGHGLTDADRAPWLARLRALLDARLAHGPPTVLACSALRRRYRAALGADRDAVLTVWLDVPRAELARRLAARRGHVAGPDLLPSQLGTLEPPAGALRLDGTAEVGDLVRAVRDAL